MRVNKCYINNNTSGSIIIICDIFTLLYTPELYSVFINNVQCKTYLQVCTCISNVPPRAIHHIWRLLHLLSSTLIVHIDLLTLISSLYLFIFNNLLVFILCLSIHLSIQTNTPHNKRHKCKIYRKAPGFDMLNEFSINCSTPQGMCGCVRVPDDTDGSAHVAVSRKCGRLGLDVDVPRR